MSPAHFYAGDIFFFASMVVHYDSSTILKTAVSA